MYVFVFIDVIIYKNHTFTSSEINLLRRSGLLAAAEKKYLDNEVCLLSEERHKCDFSVFFLRDLDIFQCKNEINCNVLY